MDTLERVINEPMDTEDILYYFPDAKILQYKNLEKYKSIKELLPKKPDFLFLLYEDSPQKGHWTALTRDTHNNINYFDSYGGKIDAPLSWTSPQIRKQLQQDKKFLSMLLNKTPEEVFFNDEDYQKDGMDINTCGRHCSFYILNMLKKGFSLHDYYKFIKKLKTKNKMSYDEVVAHYIDKI